MATGSRPRRIGIVGYGKLGQYLVKAVMDSAELELAFVWNRSSDTIPASLPQLADLHNVSQVTTNGRKPLFDRPEQEIQRER